MTTKRAASPRGMKVREFIALLPGQVACELPKHLQAFHVREQFGNLVKLYYGDSPNIHYEVWVQRRRNQIELGLHFEADAETNDRCLALLAQTFSVIRQGLGAAAEPEQWTRSWTRIHETVPLGPLDKRLLHRVASRLARYITTLQPLLRAATPSEATGD